MTRIMPTNNFNPRYKLQFFRKDHYTRRSFKYGKFVYGTIIGGALSYLLTDNSYLRNEFNSRPDLNHFRIMTGEIPDQERKVFEMFGENYFGKNFKDQPVSWVKKFKAFFYPSVDYNPHSSHYLPFYNYKKAYFPDELGNYYTS